MVARGELVTDVEIGDHAGVKVHYTGSIHCYARDTDLDS